MAYARRFLLGTNSTSNAILAPEVPEPPPQEVTGETDFVVILAALICAIICVLGLIAVARCTWLRRGIPPAGSNSGAGHPAANKGLKKKVLNALPRYTYNSNTKLESKTNVSVKTEDCAICLTEYVDGDEIRVLPHCGHGFHVECIDMWLASHSSCPSCRQILAVTRCRKCGEVDSAVDGGGGSYKLTKVKPVSLGENGQNSSSDPDVDVGVNPTKPLTNARGSSFIRDISNSLQRKSDLMP